GVITIIFFLFNVLPGDPAEIILGQRASREAIEAVHRDLGTDRPLHVQYLAYLNDFSPLSLHQTKNQQSILYLNPDKYNWTPLLEAGQYCLVLKYPYLR